MNILYGLPSEGMGHATRSKVIIQYLLKEHNVQVVTSDKAFVYLSKYFPNCIHQIEGFHLAYKNAEISYPKTIFDIFKNAPKNLINNFKQHLKLFQEFKPDLIISDFESFTQFYAMMHKIPLISIDNMQIISRCKLDIDIPFEEQANYLISKNIIKAKVHHAYRYLITTFFYPEVYKERTILFPSVVRDEIIQAKTSEDDHILVYQTSSSDLELIEILKSIPNERFYVYGFNREESYDNVSLKKFSETEFIQHFSSAKAVMSNGGFSFLSEAVYLHKPILTVPIKNQFEQYVNSAYVQKLQYGAHCSNFSIENITNFLKNLPNYKAQLSNYKQNGNEQLFKLLDDLLMEVKP